MTNIDHEELARRIEKSIHDNNEAAFMVPTSQCIANVLREALSTSEACKWTQGDWHHSGKWDSDCGHSFWIDQGKPVENGMKFCCFCGEKVVDVPFDEPEDDES